MTSKVDAVYLTDGKRNGPCSNNLANEVKCFHSRPNINTYAIAIGNPAIESVQVLENPQNTNYAHLFNMSDFDELQEVFDAILEILDQEDSDSDLMFDCFPHNQVPCCNG